MLLPDNVHPEQSIYYNAGFVLRVLRVINSPTLIELYVATREYRQISMPVFVLCLDWLFLINLVRFGDEGQIELCS